MLAVTIGWNSDQDMRVVLAQELILVCINVCRGATVLVACKCFSASNKLPAFRASGMHHRIYLNPKIGSIPSKINTANPFIQCYSKTYFNIKVFLFIKDFSIHQLIHK
jgi:hypothetical protein